MADTCVSSVWYDLSACKTCIIIYEQVLKFMYHAKTSYRVLIIIRSGNDYIPDYSFPIAIAIVHFATNQISVDTDAWRGVHRREAVGDRRVLVAGRGRPLGGVRRGKEGRLGPNDILIMARLVNL